MVKVPSPLSCNITHGLSKHPWKNNNNEYLECLTHTGPKHLQLHIVYKYLLSKFNACNMNAHTHVLCVIMHSLSSCSITRPGQPPPKATQTVRHQVRSHTSWSAMTKTTSKSVIMQCLTWQCSSTETMIHRLSLGNEIHSMDTPPMKSWFTLHHLAVVHRHIENGLMT